MAHENFLEVRDLKVQYEDTHYNKFVVGVATPCSDGGEIYNPKGCTDAVFLKVNDVTLRIDITQDGRVRIFSGYDHKIIDPYENRKNNCFFAVVKTK